MSLSGLKKKKIVKIEASDFLAERFNKDDHLDGILLLIKLRKKEIVDACWP